MYDIRFAPDPDIKGAYSKSKGWRQTSTRPYLTFADYTPDVIPDFDVSTELSLIASGMHISHCFEIGSTDTTSSLG
jgi:hypothetical protein